MSKPKKITNYFVATHPSTKHKTKSCHISRNCLTPKRLWGSANCQTCLHNGAAKKRHSDNGAAKTAQQQRRCKNGSKNVAARTTQQQRSSNNDAATTEQQKGAVSRAPQKWCSEKGAAREFSDLSQPAQTVRKTRWISIYRCVISTRRILGGGGSKKIKNRTATIPCLVYP